MAESKKSPKAVKPIADVAQPGKTPPSETSRSIITHRSLMQDPMVKAETAADTDQAEAPAAPATTKSPKIGGEMKLQPLAEPSEVPVDAAAEEPAALPAKPPETETAPEPDPDMPAEGSPDKPTHDAEAAAAEAKKTEHDAAIQKLIINKQYFLPINAVERRRSKRFVALGITLSILLALAWVNIALDASLIQIDNIKPLTHFFSN